ncbi:MAG: PAS domain-containing protein, partial [Holosporales bacterium]|nr:PAS domain-containing protein [Holosporales bacterium]
MLEEILEKLINLIPKHIILLTFIILIVLLIFSIYLCIKIYTKNKTLNYYINIIRTFSKSISSKQEFIAFNENGEIIFTTHPYMYSNKKEFISSINTRVKASSELKTFCDMTLAGKQFETLLHGTVNSLQKQKKLVAEILHVNTEESFTKTDLDIISIKDISKYLDETERISRNYEKLENFLNNFPFGIFYVNNSGIILGANLTFSNMLKLDRNKIVGEDIRDFIPEFNYDIPVQKMMNVSLRQRFSPDINVTLIKSSVSSALSMQPWIIYKNDRNSVKVEKKNEFLDQESFIAAPIPSVITDTSGEIKALNPAFAAMIQDKVILEKNKIIKPGANILNFIISEQSENSIIVHLKKAFISAENPNPVEIKFSGGKIIATAFINRIETKQNEDLLLIQLVDISGQKILEQQFIQSQKMQAIGQLAGGVAHDFNNLLTAMIGFCDLLLQRYTQNDPSYADVLQIKQNANRAANLVRQLLAFSRQQALKPRVISVTEILAELSSLLKRLIGANIDFQMIHGRDLWPIKADTSQLEQVIINLAINARDAMSKGGKLIIQTRNFFTEKEFKCVYDIANSGDYVLMEVIDTGCGIDANILEN